VKKLDRKLLSWSLLFCILIPYFLPSDLSNGNYSYGFPLEYIDIHQKEPHSVWFFDNFFGGNSALAINPAAFLLNACHLSNN
jgi:hypothetical protein